MKVGLSACSDGHIKEWEYQVDELVQVLKDFGMEPVLAPHIKAKEDTFSGKDEERAADLMRFYTDDSIEAIYDISGGDLANGVLKYLDFDVIAGSDKVFWGYSDLTTVINAIYAITGKSSVLYQVKNMVYSQAELQRKRFSDYLEGSTASLFDLNYEFLQESHMEGTVVGGNIRCLTKLAGTKYWPDMTGKILLLESLGGGSGQIATLLTQLEQIGVFDKVSGILLGTFTNYEKEDYKLSVFDLLKMHISDTLPIACTKEIGHGHDSKAIVIGEKLKL
ncbi:S66 family peptidase [Butyrivibrio sp. M55]|uniref:S66 family peptidase n=1 Tax=Butyrivibrio sp. M55 TaxID=1855323 RepID=UPI0008E884B6|nr:S66 peptidase family protein [Butyrivibrio sp. M55]SFU43611.1 Muramoyltetrapeptide carboxypeptidase LdcA (peptidoglycan recycling) [Butyrivibrio sp. M55]